jgi:hypothetical protein
MGGGFSDIGSRNIAIKHSKHPSQGEQLAAGWRPEYFTVFQHLITGKDSYVVPLYLIKKQVSDGRSDASTRQSESVMLVSSRFSFAKERLQTAGWIETGSEAKHITTSPPRLTSFLPLLLAGVLLALPWYAPCNLHAFPTSGVGDVWWGIVF